MGSLLGPFGSLNTAEHTPTAQATAVYGLNRSQWVTASIGAGASIVATNAIASCSSGTSTSGSATLELRRGLKYRAGEGGICKITAVFSPGVPDTLQLAGIGTIDCGYYFAMTGSNFGIMHNAVAKREIRKLTFSTGTGGAETLTITLNGDTKTVSIGGAMGVNQLSYTIAQQDFSQVGSGWFVDAVDGTVFFLSMRAQSLGGTYSFATSGGGTAAGTFSQIQPGAVPNQTFISQSSWNIDTMDGRGPTRMVLNNQKGNVYTVGYQYLGFGNAVFSIEDPETSLFTPVHRIQNANTRDTVVLRNPYMHARVAAENYGSSTGVTIKTASAATFTEGKVARNIGVMYATGSVKTGVGSTIVPLLTVKPMAVFNNFSCYGAIDPFNISIGTDFTGATATNILNVYVYRNITLTGPVNYSYVDLGNSLALSDLAATGVTLGSGQLLKSFAVSANSSTILTLESEEFFVTQRDSLTVAVAATGGTATVSAGLSWFEDQ